jgi:hypothetical protein
VPQGNRGRGALASKEPDEVAKHFVAVLRQQYADADLGKLRFRISPEEAVALVKQALVAHAEKQLREQKGD